MFLAAYREKYRIKRDIDETNLEILKVVQDMKGLSHHGIEMTPEQMRSSLLRAHSMYSCTMRK